jgi:hypothetical protein
MQLPPQLISVPGQDTWQEPFAHTFPLLQAAPALPDPPAPHAPLAPQYELLLSGSTQMPPQSISFPGHETWQLPLPQTLPTAHEAPALPPPVAVQEPLAPQLLRLVCGSMQIPPQLISLPGHETWHVPFAHTLPLVHAAPAVPASPKPQAPLAPQFVRLESGSMQLPLQSISVPGHETWQLPFAQTFPLLHAVPTLPAPPTPHAPLAPQYELLVRGSTQMPPQLISLPGHETWQVPLPQTLPTGQETPALPPPFPHSPLAPQ